jgi:pyrroline-5-carboxylate reductase
MSENSQSWKIAIIGTGVIGGGIAQLFAGKHKIILYDREVEKAKKLAAKIGGDFVETPQDLLAQNPDALIFAVKPRDIADAASPYYGNLRKEQIVFSTLAGTSIDTLAKNFGEVSIVRMMPNIALVYGQAVVGLTAQEKLPNEIREGVDELLKPLGLTIWIPEDKMDSIASLTGSGPAFVFLMIEAMVEAGIQMGFSSQISLELVLKMLEGSIALLRESGKHPGQLKWEVCSPGGTTIVGLAEMERKGVRSGIIDTFLATQLQAKKLH